MRIKLSEIYMSVTNHEMSRIIVVMKWLDT